MERRKFLAVIAGVLPVFVFVQSLFSIFAKDSKLKTCKGGMTAFLRDHPPRALTITKGQSLDAVYWDEEAAPFDSAYVWCAETEQWKYMRFSDF